MNRAEGEEDGYFLNSTLITNNLLCLVVYMFSTCFSKASTCASNTLTTLCCGVPLGCVALGTCS